MKGPKSKILQNIITGITNAFRLRAKYTCPFCHNKIFHFQEIGEDAEVIKTKKIVGAGKRMEGCPYCRSTDRERVVYIYLKKELKILKKDAGYKILHFAPERNLTQKLLKRFKNKYICGDLFTEGYTYPKHVQNINILQIPFEDKVFDLVICNHVLEHIQDDGKALEEIYRVLKPGGKAILQVPISGNTARTTEDLKIKDPLTRLKLYGQTDHVRIYGQDYPEILAKAGFTVNRINISSKYQKYKLNIEEDLFVVEK